MNVIVVHPDVFDVNVNHLGI